ncbi:hypothetical protein NSZ01_20990 [Nocardioides szechwanensis]|uniref:Parallel beta-helix repeat (Two copies) n=1 Tax=Nocardioides szechwanensis TaxID=1005944 RepID=A0A1H0HYU9_9ACTN|nr:glycosyl hydrolase family 28-related protein [Nocardioides szechwanensis]GEP34331.1 hypothetical protein NSZ01_20990 [Nocardioides szechwanensis]SDO24315.1 parallel beta-helix repeat (two copies) [Nocardioides szechwanensis]
MADVIKFRHGTSAQWAAADPVLQAGEPGFETNTGRHKIGDGSSVWRDLPYFHYEPALDDWYAAHPPTYVTETPGGLVVNVQDAAYGAKGDGETDDTAAIQKALDATAGGGVCYFPPGTYLVRSGNPSILVGSSKVTFHGGGSPNIGSAVYASNSSSAQRNIWVRGCRFEAFMPGQTAPAYAAVYVWTSDGVHVEDNEFVGCGRAVTIDQPDGVARVVGNRVTSSDPELMATGIFIRRANGASQSEVLVSGNYVSGARLDPGGVGAEGHGIAVFRCQDVQVTSDHLQGNRRGILVSNQCFGAIVQGNTCVDNSDAGIRCEPEISATDVTVGTDLQRGITVIGNVCRNNANDPSIGAPGGANSGIGIAMSYAAGSTVSGNTVHHNTGDGIFCDSDRVAIIGDIVYSNFTGYTSDPTTGRRGGIRIIVGSGRTVIGIQCFDNQSPKTQHYGLSMSGTAAHLVHGNNFAGNATGEVFGADKIQDGFLRGHPRRPPTQPRHRQRAQRHPGAQQPGHLRQLGLVL